MALPRRRRVRKAVFAVAFMEHEEAGVVNGDDEVSRKAKGIACPFRASAREGFHPDEPPDIAGSESGEGVGTHMSEEMGEGFVHGERVLLRSSEAIGIVQHLYFGITQFVVQLAAARQLKTEQQQAPPGEKLLVIADEGGKARVAQLVELRVEGGPEMSDRFDKAAAEFYDLPARPWRAFTCVRT